MHTFEVERLQFDGLDLNIPEVAQVTNLATTPATGNTVGNWNSGTSVFITTEGSLAVGPDPSLAHGDYLMSCVTAASASSGCHLDIGSITNGATVSVRIWVSKGAGDSVKVAIGRKTTPFTEHVVVAAHSSAALTEYTLTFTATATDTYSLYLRNTGTAATTIFFHAAMVNLGALVPFADGRHPGYEWSGTADVSTSVPVSAELAMTDLDLTPPPKTFEWARSADQHGATLIRPPFHELRQIQVGLRVPPQADMDAALDILGELVDKVQSAEREAAGGLSRGLELVYTPAGSTYSFTFYVQAAEVVGVLPDRVERVIKSPTVSVVFWCDPTGYEDEVSTSVTSSTLPLVTKAITGVGGDIAAEARLTVTDTASQARDHVEFGVEAGANAWAHLVPSTSLVTSGYAGSANTRTGAYS